MIKQTDVKVGDKVSYVPTQYKKAIHIFGNFGLVIGSKDRYENGIVKEIPTHTTDSVRVVYNCNNNWDHYQDYTSALTNVRDLELGWKQD